MWHWREEWGTALRIPVVQRLRLLFALTQWQPEQKKQAESSNKNENHTGVTKTWQEKEKFFSKKIKSAP